MKPIKMCKESECKNFAAEGRSRCFSCYGKSRRKEAKKIVPKSPDGKMKVLMLDIETKPNKAYTWGIWNVNIGINQIIEPGEMICFAAKWYGQDDIEFYSQWGDTQTGMVTEAHRLLDEADIVVHFYGSKFDIPHLNTEFLKQGFPPPSPYKQIDLKVAVGKQFRFTSNKLQFVSEVLGLAGKEEHEGFGLWDKVMNEREQYTREVEFDAKARMESYNKQDVFLLDEVYEALLPWIPGAPNRRLYEGGSICPSCGADSEYILQDGFFYTKLSKFLQYRCQTCNSWFRGNRRMAGVNLQEAVL